LGRVSSCLMKGFVIILSQYVRLDRILNFFEIARLLSCHKQAIDSLKLYALCISSGVSARVDKQYVFGTVIYSLIFS
jgi:hypothetical protein